MHANPRGCLAFDDEDVARAYVHRPPYPDALFDFLGDLTVNHRRALDLGCGPGKIAHRLASTFDHIDAVDPSAAMLWIADDGRHPNINWIHGFAESADLPGPYDLVTAGASIHWMDHSVLFPRLAAMLSEGGVIAVLGGDHAHDVPWDAAWEAFLQRWLEILGDEYDPGGYRDAMSRFRSWMDIHGERTFEGSFTQSIDHFIECQHSRATWSRANLGPDLTAIFDAELRELLSPYANNELISYTTRAEVVWGASNPKHSSRYKPAS